MGKIIYTVGCFDILHAGHVDYLQKAKMYGDYLIVGITSDKAMRKVKRKPIFNETERAKILESLACVDEVLITDRAADDLEKIRPDVYVKGGDYNLGTMNQDERKILKGYDAKIIFIPIVYQRSSSKI